jgi:type VI secretion system protein ImpC
MAEAQQQASAAPAVTEEKQAEASTLTSLLQKETRQPIDRIQQAAETLASQALEGVDLVGADVLSTINAIIAAIDKKLTKQVNKIVHHPDFQKLESAWRGLHYLVNNTESGTDMKIRVMNISKNDLGKTLKKYKGTAWDQSPLFKAVYEGEYGVAGGQPYGCLVGDFEFDHTAPDMEIMEGMSQIAAAAHAPFITAPSPNLLNMDSWQELSKPRDLSKIFQTADYARWNSFRQSEDSRYVGMCMPRFLGRMPYGEKTNPVEEFAFEEETEGAEHGKYLWCNAAYAMARNINRAFKNYGWCAAIRGAESGGMVENLPVHSFPTDDGGVDAKCPTEIAITDRREKELSDNGMLALCHYKNTDYAVFFGGQSAHKPQAFMDPADQENANLSARLPYIFATSRFAHYLKCMVRDKIGSLKSREDMETMLNNWIMHYVEPDPTASEKRKAERPLADAKVIVEDVEGNPGYYSAKFLLRPHFQLEGMTIAMSLVSRLPGAGG